MSAKNLPEGYVLDADVSELALTDGYEHVTVADLRELLEDYPQDARVWLSEPEWPDEGDVRVRPLELIFGSEGEVFL